MDTPVLLPQCQGEGTQASSGPCERGLGTEHILGHQDTRTTLGSGPSARPYPNLGARLFHTHAVASALAGSTACGHRHVQTGARARAHARLGLLHTVGADAYRALLCTHHVSVSPPALRGRHPQDLRVQMGQQRWGGGGDHSLSLTVESQDLNQLSGSGVWCRWSSWAPPCVGDTRFQGLLPPRGSVPHRSPT